MEQQAIQPIAENLWWVIPGRLAGVRQPMARELNELQTVGIGAIVSVMDDPSNLDLYEQSGIPHLWLPTKGGTAPSREQIQELQNFVDSQNQIGKAVAVHCTSGRRRTGTMLASYLIHAGSSYDSALQTIQHANPDVELREAQSTFLQELAEGASIHRSSSIKERRVKTMKLRPHISLDVTDLDASIHFYSSVFGIEPTKRRDDYANFRLEAPPLHLALVSQPGHQHRPSPNQHFGMELFEDSQLHDWREQVVAAGLVPRIEESVTCCYAVADKFWLTDPDGNEWEFWVRKDEADRMHGEEAVCCAPECCTPEPQIQAPVKTACCS